MTAIDVRLLDQLKELIGGDQESLNELVETFLEEGDGIVAAMKSSLVNKDLELLRRSAHSLKSSAQDFGALELSRFSATLESHCRNEWPEAPESQVLAIEMSFGAASTELCIFLAGQN